MKVLFPFLLVVSLISCSNEIAEKEQMLISRVQTAFQNTENINIYDIEYLRNDIRSFLEKYPNSKHYYELDNYIDKLSEIVDYYKLRNFKSNYEDLLRKKFSNPQEALKKIKELQDFLISPEGEELFNKKTEEIIPIKKALNNLLLIFSNMEFFFSYNYSDLPSFNESVNEVKEDYENSNYLSVRNTWKYLVDYYRRLQGENDKEKMITNFEYYLKEDARRICNFNYRNFDIHEIQTISVSNHYEHEKYNAEVSQGVFRLHLKGSFLGIDRGTVKISVKGMIVVKVNHNKELEKVTYENIDYQIIEITGDL
jgi:lipoprotein